MTRRLVAASIAAFALLVPSAAHAAAPVRGATYSGGSADADQVALTVSRDGKRVYDFYALNLAVTCPGDPDPVPSRTGEYGEGSEPIRAGGRIRFSTGESGATEVTGTFGPGGTLTGTVSYNDRGGCYGSVRFTASAQPRQTGTARPVFEVAHGSPVATFDLGGGALGVADTLTPFDSRARGTFKRIDRYGRASTFLRFAGGVDGAPGDAARLADGSVVAPVPFLNCIRSRSRTGTVSTVAGTCAKTPGALQSPERVAALPGGGFVFTDGGTEGAYADNSAIRRVAPGGQITTLATLPAIQGIAALRDGSVVASSANRIFRIAPTGAVTVAAGNGLNRFTGDGGPAIGAGMAPGDIAALPDGGFLFADATVQRIRRVTPSGRITAFAGGGEIATGVAAGRAHFRPTALDVLADGSVAFENEGALDFIPSAGNRRLLVGLPERAEVYRARIRAHRSLPVTVTRRARVKLTFRRGGHILSVVNARVRAGTTRITLPRHARTKGTTRLSVTAVAGRSRAGDALTIY